MYAIFIQIKCKCFNLSLLKQFIGSNILLWRRGSAVVTASSLMITRDQRFRLLEGYSLQIKGVRPQDAGDYICQIGDQENRDLVHTVEILVPPTVRAHPETGHVTARKGSTVTLECKASGNPVPSISWVKRVSFSLTDNIFYVFPFLLFYAIPGLKERNMKNKIKNLLPKSKNKLIFLYFFVIKI